MCQSADQADRRRVGKPTCRIAALHVLEIKKRARQSGVFHRRNRLWADAQNGQTCGQHKPFLAASHRDIHPPSGHFKRHRPDRRHAIHHQHRRMCCSVHREAQTCDVRFHTGCSFIMGGQNRFDRVTGILAQRRFNFRQRHPHAPRGVDDFNDQAVALAHINPAVAEHAKPRSQNRIAS